MKKEKLKFLKIPPSPGKGKEKSKKEMESVKAFSSALERKKNEEKRGGKEKLKVLKFFLISLPP